MGRRESSLGENSFSNLIGFSAFGGGSLFFSLFFGRRDQERIPCERVQSKRKETNSCYCSNGTLVT